MLKRLLFLLQSLSLIPPIGTFLFWVSIDYSPPIPGVFCICSFSHPLRINYFNQIHYLR